jgi:hypothetical protein
LRYQQRWPHAPASRVEIDATARRSDGNLERVTVGSWNGKVLQTSAREESGVLRVRDITIPLSRAEIEHALSWLDAQRLVSCPDTPAEAFNLRRASEVEFFAGSPVQITVFAPENAAFVFTARPAGYVCDERGFSIAIGR